MKKKNKPLKAKARGKVKPEAKIRLKHKKPIPKTREPLSEESVLREDPAPYGARDTNTAAKLRFIDLFAGIGGIRLGLERAGGKCVFSSKWDADATKTYEAYSS